MNGVDGTTRLEMEVRAQLGKLLSSINNRKYHPSFGYTKASIREELHRLEGMISAWAYVTGFWSVPASIDDRGLREAANHFSIELTKLREKVKES